MNRTQLFSLIFLLCFSFISAQSANCSKYYLIQEGATFEYVNLNKKGKEDGKVNYQVLNVKDTSNGSTATMKMTIENQKGDPFVSEYNLTCNGNSLSIDFKSLMSSDMMAQYGEMEAEVTGTNIDLPNNLSVGQTLPDANMNVQLEMGGVMSMNINVDTINRKVEGKETVSTPAGEFECYVIYSETKTKMMLGTKVFPSKLWLAEGLGMIKTESYNQKGKLIGTTILSSFTK